MRHNRALYDTLVGEPYPYDKSIINAYKYDTSIHILKCCNLLQPFYNSVVNIGQPILS